jgi:hypothetical protein
MVSQPGQGTPTPPCEVNAAEYEIGCIAAWCRHKQPVRLAEPLEAFARVIVCCAYFAIRGGEPLVE